MISIKIKTLRDYRYDRRVKRTAKKLAEGQPFSDKELTYAAYSLCPCGAGIATPKYSGIDGYWDCSDILKGLVVQGAAPVRSPSSPDRTKPNWDGKHTDQLPYAFYEIKSENQPSAKGATTRP